MGKAKERRGAKAPEAKKAAGAAKSQEGGASSSSGAHNLVRAAITFGATVAGILVGNFFGASPGVTAGPAGPDIWAPANESFLSPLTSNVGCAEGDHGQGACSEPRRKNGCARFVLDEALQKDDVEELRKMVEWLVDEAWGAGSGPPSVIDLHAKSISYKDKFVDLSAFMEFKQLNFTEKQVSSYVAARNAIRHYLSELFGVPEADLLHDLTFFSHINASKEAQTLHDEYWHEHVDTQQYGTFAYTALLYLSTQRVDFEGGSFVFTSTEANKEPQYAEPRFGRLVAFTSDAENPHQVEKVTSGVRIALTAAFTCDKTKAASIDAFPSVSKPDANASVKE